MCAGLSCNEPFEPSSILPNNQKIVALSGMFHFSEENRKQGEFLVQVEIESFKRAGLSPFPSSDAIEYHSYAFFDVECSWAIPMLP